jgi:elongation factor 1-beta
MQNAESLVARTNVQNVGLVDHRRWGNAKMGSVIITYKIFPTDVLENFDALKKEINGQLPEFCSVEGYGEEPIAFGLKALLVQIKFPEDQTGILDEFEKKIEGIEGISQIQTLMVRRTSR